MPIYRYRATDPEQGCDRCREAFEELQTLSDPPLAACPDCGLAVRRLVGGGQCVTNRRWNTKKMLSDGNLKRLGFKKLVKEGDGKYRDVLRD